MNRAQYAEKLLWILKDFPEFLFSGDLYEGAEFPERDFKVVIEYYVNIEYPTRGSHILTLKDIGTYRRSVGIFKKHIGSTGSHLFSFSPDGGKTFIHSETVSKMISDSICERVIPFLTSCGTDKSTIPLLIHDFPEYASYALNYVPDADQR